MNVDVGMEADDGRMEALAGNLSFHRMMDEEGVLPERSAGFPALLLRRLLGRCLELWT